MEITGLYIDGYKNVRNTYLDLESQPIIALLAPNNYGKSNLVEGIHRSFELIKKTESPLFEYLTKKFFNYTNEIADLKYSPFEFWVEFILTSDDGIEKRKYKYELVIEPKVKQLSLSTKGNEKATVVCSAEIKREQLTRVDGKETVLFKRMPGFAVKVFTGNTSINLTMSPTSRRCKYKCDGSEGCHQPICPSLFLNKLGGLIDIAENAGNTWVSLHRETINEIGNVMMNLTSGDYELSLISSGDYGEYKSEEDIEKHIAELLDTETFENFANTFEKIFDYYKITSAYIKNKPSAVFNDTRRKLPNGECLREYTGTLSFGTRRVFKLLSQVYSSAAPLVSIEDIENGLNPRQYREFIKGLSSALENANDKQRLIITTHSPGIIDVFSSSLEAIYIGLPSAGKKAEAEFRRLSKTGIDKISQLIRKSTEFLNAGSYLFSLCLEDFTEDEVEENGWYESAAKNPNKE